MALAIGSLIGADVQARTCEAVDTLSASDAFVHLPASVLDILSSSMRLDMLDYYKVDSIADVANAMEGFSHLNPPLNREYLQVQITPVSTLTVRILPSRKHQMFATVYTVGDSIQAADSEIRFYDVNYKELDKSKFFKIPATEDFFDLRDLSGKEKRELLSIVPFPTVELVMDPVSTDLIANLTVGEFLGKEDLEKIRPYLRRTRVYRWNCSRYEPVPLPMR